MVERFTTKAIAEAGANPPDSSEHGLFVYHSAFAALEAEIERLKFASDTLASENSYLAGRVYRAEARLAELEKAEPVAWQGKDEGGAHWVFLRHPPGVGAWHETRALYTHPAPSPERDMVTVPREPTEAMIEAGVAMAMQVTIHGQGGWPEYISGLYRQMIASVAKEAIR